jgi:hypothetical protein
VDPSPLSVLAVEQLFSEALGKRFLYLPVPKGFARFLFSFRPVERFFGMPRETLDYFDHPCAYDASQAVADLTPLGIRCPSFGSYVQGLVRFYSGHRDAVRREAMV